MNNTDIARRAIDLARGLADCDHLPTVSDASITKDTSTLFFWRDHDGDRSLGMWAAAFEAPVVVDLSRGGEIRACIKLSGHQVDLSTPAPRKAQLLGTVAGIPVGAEGELTLTAEQLLSALDANVDPPSQDVVSEVER